MKQPQEMVQQPVVFQNGQPGVGAEQEIHPHREHDQDHGDGAPPFSQSRHGVGHRIAQQKTDHRGDDREAEGIEEYDEDELRKRNISVAYLEEDDINTEKLLDLQDEYEPEQVAIAVAGGRVTFWGQGLQLDCLSADSILLTGRIQSVEFADE